MLGAPFVEYIHDELLQQFWPASESIGALGVKNRGLLESAVGRPFQSAFGQDIYPNVVHKAAALFHSLVSNHPFHDGNKRTAVVAVEHFLLANGFLPSLSNQEFYELAKHTASYRERGELHDEVLNEIRKQLTAGTASFAQVRKEFTKVRRQIEKKREERANFRRRVARAVAASAGDRQQTGLLLKAELAKIEKELKKLEPQYLASIVELYAVATEMRRHIRRSPKNLLVLPL
jgi:death-on-curing family protein